MILIPLGILAKNPMIKVMGGSNLIHTMAINVENRNKQKMIIKEEKMADYQCKKELSKYDLHNDTTLTIEIGEVWESGDEREGLHGWEYKMGNYFNWSEFWIEEDELKEYFAKIRD